MSTFGFGWSSQDSPRATHWRPNPSPLLHPKGLKGDYLVLGLVDPGLRYQKLVLELMCASTETETLFHWLLVFRSAIGPWIDIC